MKRNNKLYYFILFITLSSILGCDTAIQIKNFLFQNPNIKFQLDGHDKIYNKYTPISEFKKMDCENRVITFFIDEKKYDVFVNADYQQIGNTKYKVRKKY